MPIRLVYYFCKLRPNGWLFQSVCAFFLKKILFFIFPFPYSTDAFFSLTKGEFIYKSVCQSATTLSELVVRSECWSDLLRVRYLLLVQCVFLRSRLQLLLILGSRIASLQLPRKTKSSCSWSLPLWRVKQRVRPWIDHGCFQGLSLSPARKQSFVLEPCVSQGRRSFSCKYKCTTAFFSSLELVCQTTFANLHSQETCSTVIRKKKKSE